MNDIMYFDSPGKFRHWLRANHLSSPELLVGFHKKTSGLGGITYAEALDEALCHGWIDGVRRNVDDASYSIRFTPRRPGSIWSLVNVGHAERLIAAGRMRPQGKKAFEARQVHKTGIYSFEQKQHILAPAFERKFRSNRTAWTFWKKQPPGYQRVSIHWVMSAKQEETRERRLAQLIADSAAGCRLAQATGKKRAS